MCSTSKFVWCTPAVCSASSLGRYTQTVGGQLAKRLALLNSQAFCFYDDDKPGARAGPREHWTQHRKRSEKHTAFVAQKPGQAGSIRARNGTDAICAGGPGWASNGATIDSVDHANHHTCMLYRQTIIQANYHTGKPPYRCSGCSVTVENHHASLHARHKRPSKNLMPTPPSQS